MAIVGIKNSLSCRAFKLRFPRRFRSRVRKTENPSREITGGGGSSGVGDGGDLVPRVSTKEDEFRQVFRYFDTDNDGKISVDELRDYFASVGDSVSDEDAKKIIREFSKGGGRGEDSILLELEFGEFVKMMELRDSDDDNVLRRAFEMYEVEKGSGCITPEGLRHVLRRLGDVKSYQECEAMIRVFDLDGNGVLDYHEFQKMMT